MNIGHMTTSLVSTDILLYNCLFQALQVIIFTASLEPSLGQHGSSSHRLPISQVALAPSHLSRLDLPLVRLSSLRIITPNYCQTPPQVEFPCCLSILEPSVMIPSTQHTISYCALSSGSLGMVTLGPEQRARCKKAQHSELSPFFDRPSKNWTQIQSWFNSRAKGQLLFPISIHEFQPSANSQLQHISSLVLQEDLWELHID